MKAGGPKLNATLAFLARLRFARSSPILKQECRLLLSLLDSVARDGWSHFMAKRGCHRHADRSGFVSSLIRSQTAGAIAIDYYVSAACADDLTKKRLRKGAVLCVMKSGPPSSHLERRSTPLA